jgi:hypothetical protein
MNYDDQVLGVYNSQHPANQKEIEQEEFDSVNLQECLDYAKETKDFEWIETAIIKQNTAIEKAVSELDLLIDTYHHTYQTFLKNRLKAIKRELMFNQ